MVKNFHDMYSSPEEFSKVLAILVDCLNEEIDGIKQAILLHDKKMNETLQEGEKELLKITLQQYEDTFFYYQKRLLNMMKSSKKHGEK